MAYTILLVEDDVRTRDRLAAVIAVHADFRLLAAVGSCAEARAELGAQTPDVLLLDLGLPDGEGGRLIPEALRAGSRVVVLTVFNNSQRLEAALAAGAYGFLFKDSSPRVITRTLTNLFADAPGPATH
ncbi:MAG: response regulator, partial [Betaproteobacteria bacterium]